MAKLNKEVNFNIISDNSIHDITLLNEEFEKFAYVVSHDFQAPLRGMSKLVEWLVKDNENVFSENSLHYFGLLQDRMFYLDTMVEDLLQFSRLGFNKSECQIKIDIYQLLNQLIDNPPFNEASFIISDSLPTITADPKYIKTIFQHLLQNAIKFNHTEKPEIIIECDQHSEYYYWFSVIDNGPGIDEEFHESVFEVFKTLQSKDLYKGTGMGLALVKKIIELNGGRVNIETIENGGTKVLFSWPK